MVAAGDTFINDMMKYCGLENIFSEKKRYPQISLQEIERKNVNLFCFLPNLILSKKSIKKQYKSELPDIKIRLVDGEMFSWYGSRLLKSADYFQSFLISSPVHRLPIHNSILP